MTSATRPARTAPPAASRRPPPAPDADTANEAIRAYVLAHGDRPWGARETAELHRLRTAWLAAVRGKEQDAPSSPAAVNSGDSGPHRA